MTDMLTPSDLAIGAAKEALRFIAIMLCVVGIFRLESLVLGTVVFLGVFFVGFMVGVFESSYWDDETPDELGRPMLYLLFLLGGGFIIALKPLVGAAVVFLFVMNVWDAYHANQRFESGEQPYQKYDWFPQNAMKFPLVPYYYVKAYAQYKREHDNES